ncbi:uncharacterized protein CLUP02_15308 [Colletotrichum lupini]|uniref:Bacteriophage T5 Orf172 DNA-binding domain-containing protein n=1 Tax=Colletotrichum lupini TaxID=145971 RepID=A0A9Q8T7R3_9PEZI|nr:uncharacterized protein CLUP02_15308 [Colletotrichum lupini]UQC89777.1 hypothetical protein CLUP02_15308 [Colletotrichum lupini]
MQNSPPLKVAKRRARPVKAAQLSTASSPLAPATTGTTPDQPPRRASVNVPSWNQFAGPGWTPASERPDESEVDTPSKKSVPRNRSTSAMSLKSAKPPHIEEPDNLGNVTRAKPSLHSSYTSPSLTSDIERRNQRPVVQDRSASEQPSTPAKKLSGPQIDRKLEFMIKAGPKAKSAGFLYVQVTQPREIKQRLLKIGVTKFLPEKRGKDIQYQCKHPEFFEHEDAPAVKFSWNGFAEKLVHAELTNFCRSWACGCGKKHREYFESFSYLNDTRVLWNHIYPNRWHFAAVAEALTMVFIWPTSFWTSMWWKVVLVLAMLELFCLDGMYMKESFSSLLSGSLQRVKLWSLSDLPEHGPDLEAKDPSPAVSSEQQAQNGLHEDADTEMMEDVPNGEDDDIVDGEWDESDNSSDDD